MSKIRAARLSSGMTVSEAAEKAGVSISFLYQVESGERSIDSDVAEKIAKAYQVDVSEIFEIKRYVIK